MSKLKTLMSVTSVAALLIASSVFATGDTFDNGKKIEPPPLGEKAPFFKGKKTGGTATIVDEQGRPKHVAIYVKDGRRVVYTTNTEGKSAALNIDHPDAGDHVKEDAPAYSKEDPNLPPGYDDKHPNAVPSYHQSQIEAHHPGSPARHNE